jgi:hypothetical protein
MKRDITLTEISVGIPTGGLARLWLAPNLYAVLFAEISLFSITKSWQASFLWEERYFLGRPFGEYLQTLDLRQAAERFRANDVFHGVDPVFQAAYEAVWPELAREFQQEEKT